MFKFNQFPFILAALTAIALTVSSCKRDDPNAFDPNDKGAITLEFDNKVGSQELVLNTQTYTNAANEPFTVSLLQYYVSNISLKDSKGNVYTVPQDLSYFMVQEHKPATHTITLSNVPAGDYTEVTFTIGVDSLRNTMGPEKRTGVLDMNNYQGPNENMYWSWNSGYIHFKLEGTSPSITPDSLGNQIFKYHIGGFGGYSSPTINNIRVVTLPFNMEAAKVRKDKNPQVHVELDLLKFFSGHHNFSIAANPKVHFNPLSTQLADNYMHAFKVDHVHNQ